MHKSSIIVSVLVVLALTACEPETEFTMPDVTGQKLDVAYQEIADAGFDDKDAVEIDGGGTFGVVKEDNWTVCSQTPEAGTQGTDAPTLTIARSCDDESAEDPSDEPSAEPTDEPSEETSTTPSASPSDAPTPEVPTVITTENSAYFEQVLSVEDYCDPVIGRFAAEYDGLTIEFDGSVSATGGGTYTVSPGDDGQTSVVGPSFQFPSAGLSLTANDLVRVTATVGTFDQDQCLFKIANVTADAR